MVWCKGVLCTLALLGLLVSASAEESKHDKPVLASVGTAAVRRTAPMPGAPGGHAGTQHNNNTQAPNTTAAQAPNKPKQSGSKQPLTRPAGRSRALPNLPGRGPSSAPGNAKPGLSRQGIPGSNKQRSSNGKQNSGVNGLFTLYNGNKPHDKHVAADQDSRQHGRSVGKQGSSSGQQGNLNGLFTTFHKDKPHGTVRTKPQSGKEDHDDKQHGSYDHQGSQYGPGKGGESHAPYGTTGEAGGNSYTRPEDGSKLHDGYEREKEVMYSGEDDSVKRGHQGPHEVDHHHGSSPLLHEQGQDDELQHDERDVHADDRHVPDLRGYDERKDYDDPGHRSDHEAKERDERPYHEHDRSYRAANDDQQERPYGIDDSGYLKDKDAREEPYDQDHEGRHHNTDELRHKEAGIYHDKADGSGMPHRAASLDVSDEGDSYLYEEEPHWVDVEELDQLEDVAHHYVHSGNSLYDLGYAEYGDEGHEYKGDTHHEKSESEVFWEKVFGKDKQTGEGDTSPHKVKDHHQGEQGKEHSSDKTNVKYGYDKNGYIHAIPIDFTKRSFAEKPEGVTNQKMPFKGLKHLNSEKKGFTNPKSGVDQVHSSTYDQDGYDKQGYDKYGYDRRGYNRMGYHKDGSHKDGYDKDGYDKFGYDQEGFDRNGIDKYGYDRYGYDFPKGVEDDLVYLSRYGYDKDGFRGGYDVYGFDKSGYNREGYDWYGYNRQGVNREGKLKPPARNTATVVKQIAQPGRYVNPVGWTSNNSIPATPSPMPSSTASVRPPSTSTPTAQATVLDNRYVQGGFDARKAWDSKPTAVGPTDIKAIQHITRGAAVESKLKDVRPAAAEEEPADKVADSKHASDRSAVSKAEGSPLTTDKPGERETANRTSNNYEAHGKPVDSKPAQAGNLAANTTEEKKPAAVGNNLTTDRPSDSKADKAPADANPSPADERVASSRPGEKMPADSTPASDKPAVSKAEGAQQVLTDVVGFFVGFVG